MQKAILDRNYYLGIPNKCHKLNSQRRTTEDMHVCAIENMCGRTLGRDDPY
jgi:hypothetical protein